MARKKLIKRKFDASQVARELDLAVQEAVDRSGANASAKPNPTKAVGGPLVSEVIERRLFQ